MKNPAIYTYTNQLSVTTVFRIFVTVFKVRIRAKNAVKSDVCYQGVLTEALSAYNKIPCKFYSRRGTEES